MTPHREERNPPVETLLFDAIGRELDRNVWSMCVVPAKPGTFASITLIHDEDGKLVRHEPITAATSAEALRAAVKFIADREEAA